MRALAQNEFLSDKYQKGDDAVAGLAGNPYSPYDTWGDAFLETRGFSTDPAWMTIGLFVNLGEQLLLT